MNNRTSGIRLTVDTKQPFKETIRELIITGEFGQLWEKFCHENAIDDKLKTAFLDYLNSYIDGECDSNRGVGQTIEET